MEAIATVRNDKTYVKPTGISATSRLAVNKFQFRLLEEWGGRGLEGAEIQKLAKRLELENVRPEAAKELARKPFSKIIEIGSWTGYSEVGEREAAFQMVKDALEMGVLKGHHGEMVRMLVDVVSRKEDPMALNALEILGKRSPHELAKVVHLAFSNPDEKTAIAALEFAFKRGARLENAQPIKQTVAMMAETEPRAGVSDAAFKVLARLDFDSAVDLMVRAVGLPEGSVDRRLAMLEEEINRVSSDPYRDSLEMFQRIARGRVEHG